VSLRRRPTPCFRSVPLIHVVTFRVNRFLPAFLRVQRTIAGFAPLCSIFIVPLRALVLLFQDGDRPLMSKHTGPQVSDAVASSGSTQVFRPYERLVEIKVLGKSFEVPEKNTILRAFQYISPETIPYGRFCWNQDCQYCRVVGKLPDEDRPHELLAASSWSAQAWKSARSARN